jgi:hypothetical protein
MTDQDVTLGAMPLPSAEARHASRPRSTPGSRPGLWTRVTAFDRRLSVAKGLTLVTLLTGFFGGYFQYLSSYEDKVGAQARADMDAATRTFVELSNSFAEAAMLQELIFYNFKASLGAEDDVGDKKMTAEAGSEIFPDYVKARTNLRKQSSIFAHKAEIDIDWASDIGRDPAAPRLLGLDPLNETLLGTYNFDCDAEANLPRLSVLGLPAAPAAAPPSCTATAASQTVNVCARTADGAIDAGKSPFTIDWQSAKHHVLTMHYCFEQLHRQIVTARIWASKNPVSPERDRAFRDNQATYEANLDRQVVRLNAFMSVSMAHLERIRVKYRPSGFFCHVPLVRDAIGLFSNKCTPIRTAEARGLERVVQRADERAGVRLASRRQGPPARS